VFTQFAPEWPSTPSINIDVNKFHAKDACTRCNGSIMHRCTHMDAPLHVSECTPTINDYPLWRLFGTGVAISCPKEKWGLITPEDLENATPKIQEGDIVMINTGFHHKWADTDEYFAYGPGIGEEGAKWLVNKKVKMVGYGCQANDHPLATKLVDHGLGPTQPHLMEEYKALTGRDAKADFPNGSLRTSTSCVWVASRASRTWAATWMRSPESAAPSWRCPGVGRVVTAASCRCWPSSIRIRPSGSRRASSLGRRRRRRQKQGFERRGRGVFPGPVCVL